MIRESTRQKLREANLGKRHSAETIEKRARQLRGRKYSLEHRQKISIARKNGKPSLPKGTYHHTEETKAKMRAAHLGTHHNFSPSLEHRELLRRQQTGKRYSLETRKKISHIVSKAYADGKHNYRKTIPEQIVENILIKNGLSYKYQFYVEVHGLVHSVDFFVEPNILIECDGDFWHGTPYMYSDDTIIHPLRKVTIAELRRVDEFESDIMSECGYKILRFAEYVIRNYPEECERSILEMKQLLEG